MFGFKIAYCTLLIVTENTIKKGKYSKYLKKVK